MIQEKDGKLDFVCLPAKPEDPSPEEGSGGDGGDETDGDKAPEYVE